MTISVEMFWAVYLLIGLAFSYTTQQFIELTFIESPKMFSAATWDAVLILVKALVWPLAWVALLIILLGEPTEQT